MLPSKENILDAIKDSSNIMESRIRGFQYDKVKVGPLRGNMKYYTGGFGIVLPMSSSNIKSAFKVWYVDVSELEYRLQQIESYLKKVNLPYFVDFSFNSEGLRIPASIHDDESGCDCLLKTLVMQWIEGDTLKDFLGKLLSDSPSLHKDEIKDIAEQLRCMFKDLHSVHISHGDLQHGNIIITNEAGKNKVKLIDYDSLYVPALKGYKQTTAGLGGYQHPDRINGKYSDESTEKDDYFSEKILYASLLVLSECPELWNDPNAKIEDNDYGLLFFQTDFGAIEKSYTYQYAMEHCTSNAKQLLENIRTDLLSNISDIQPLDNLGSVDNPGKEPISEGAYAVNGKLTKKGLETLRREDSYKL